MSSDDGTTGGLGGGGDKKKGHSFRKGASKLLHRKKKKKKGGGGHDDDASVASSFSAFSAPAAPAGGGGNDDDDASSIGLHSVGGGRHDEEGASKKTHSKTKKLASAMLHPGKKVVGSVSASSVVAPSSPGKKKALSFASGTKSFVDDAVGSVRTSRSGGGGGEEGDGGSVVSSLGGSFGFTKSSSSSTSAESSEEEAALNRMENAKPGDWLVRVHVIEARDLRPTDPDGSSDPMVLCEVRFGSKRVSKATRVVNNDRNPVFDEEFRFEFDACALSDVEASTASISVVDSDSTSLSRGGRREGRSRLDDAIGSWEADLFEGVYARPDHEFYRQFVALRNPDADEKEERGVQGFLKVSVTVLGPGDKSPYHDFDKERRLERMAAAQGGGGAALANLSARETELRFLVLNVRQVVDVPYYKPEYAERLFVRAEWGGVDLSTVPVRTENVSGDRDGLGEYGWQGWNEKAKTGILPTRRCDVNQSIWIAVVHPTLCSSLKLSVWEERRGLKEGMDWKGTRLIGRLRPIKLNDVRSSSRRRRGRPRYDCRSALSFYGAPLLHSKYLKGGKDVKVHLNDSPDEATTFRGRIVLTIKDLPAKRKNGSMRPHQSVVVPSRERKGHDDSSSISSSDDDDDQEEPTPRCLTLKAQVLRGCNLPLQGRHRSHHHHSIVVDFGKSSSRDAARDHRYGVRISCGKHFVETGLERPGSSVEEGSCDWSYSGVRSVTFLDDCGGGECRDEIDDNGVAPSPASPAAHPPDVVVTLLRATSSSASSNPCPPASGSSSYSMSSHLSTPQALPICCRRISASDLLLASSTHLLGTSKEERGDDDDDGEAILLEPRAKWIHLREDDAIDALHDTVFPGSILVRLGLYRHGDASSAPASSSASPRNAKEEEGIEVVPQWTVESDAGREGGGGKEKYFDSISAVAPAAPPRWSDESDAKGKRRTSSSSSSSANDSVPFVVKIHAYAARDLPPADGDTGALDPYLLCSLGGIAKRTTTKVDDRNPTWFETLTYRTKLPSRDRRDLWPEVVLQLWDEDEGGDGDDFVGNIILSLSEAADDDDSTGGAGRHRRRPRWHDLFFQEPGDIKSGSVLLDVECMEDATGGDHPAEGPPTPSADRRGTVTTETFLPPGDERSVEILALGCRDLRGPSSFWPLRRPFVQFQVGESKPAFTPPSGRPSSKNCNFGARLRVDGVYLPDDPDLAPFLQVKVLDGWKVRGFRGLGGGGRKKGRGLGRGSRMIGVGSLSLGDDRYYEERRLDSSSWTSVGADGSEAESAGAETSSSSGGDDPSVVSDVDPRRLRERPYLRGRVHLEGELDVEPLYDRVAIHRGKRTSDDDNEDDNGGKKKSETSRYDLEEVGRLHVFARILDPSTTDASSYDDDDAWDLLAEQLVKPTLYDVRVYVLRATGIAARDSDGKSDPYVRVRIGDGKKFGRGGGWIEGEPRENTLRPRFYQRFDLTCKIPGEASLEVQLMDKDAGRDDLIGSTTIELDHRVHSKEWQAYGIRKPVERRDLFREGSGQPQGTLSMWVDVIDRKNDKFPVWDIAQSPEEEFEVRIVVWKVEGIPPGDPLTDQSDLFVKVKLGNEEWLSTDTHMFAKKGKGSFNYRIKFPVKLMDGGKIRGEGSAKLKLQVWDADILVNDVLCVTQINLARAFENAWIMKRVGSGYQHFGDAEEQLRLAAKIEAADRREATEERLKEIPINWRNDPAGYLSGAAEHFTNVMGTWGALTTGLGGDANDPTATGLKARLNPMQLFATKDGSTQDGERTSVLQGAGSGTNNGLHGGENDSNAVGEEEPLLQNQVGGDVETGDAGQSNYKSAHDEATPPTGEVSKENMSEMQRKRDLHDKKKLSNATLQHQFNASLGLTPPENSKWISFQHVDLESGEVRDADARILLSVEVLPKALAERRKNGEGRDEPNQFPVLPPPEGRVDFLKMMYNPLYAVRACLGDALAAQVGMGCCCFVVVAACLVAGVFLEPYLQIGVFVLKLVPPSVARLIGQIMVVAIAVSAAYCYFCGCKKGDKEEDEDDIELYYDDDEESEEDF